jgi:hypothetical protein
MAFKPIREPVETLTRFVPRRTWFALGILVCAAMPLRAGAQTAPLDARVIWAERDRVYLVSTDSLWLAPGATLHFFDRHKEIASGDVSAVHDAVLIAVRVTSGSLKSVKHLDRIRVTSERAALRPLRVLRVGYPSTARNRQPFFACDRLVLEPHGYRTDTLGQRSYRLVRDSTWVPPRPEPDTILVRLFDDAADEEIALERGELDAAVFWPGEASMHIRESMRWDERSSACRYRGVVATRITSPPVLGYEELSGLPRKEDRTLLDSLNVEMFHGDLRPALGSGGTGGGPARFRVEPSCPAHDAIERFLDRGVGDRPACSYELLFLDVPLDSPSGDQAVRWAFLIACPVIGRPELRPYLEAIDLSALVNLFDCVTPQRRP